MIDWIRDIISSIKPRKVDTKRVPSVLRPLIHFWNFLVSIYSPLFSIVEFVLNIFLNLTEVFKDIYYALIKSFWKTLWKLTFEPFVKLYKDKKRKKGKK